jgi:hypothetical protein
MGSTCPNHSKSSQASVAKSACRGIANLAEPLSIHLHLRQCTDIYPWTCIAFQVMDMFLIDGSHIQSHPVANSGKLAGWSSFFSIGFAAPAAAHASRDSLDLLDTSSAPRGAPRRRHRRHKASRHSARCHDTSAHRQHVTVRCLDMSRHVSIRQAPVSDIDMSKDVERCRNMSKVCPTTCVPQRVHGDRPESRASRAAAAPWPFASCGSRPGHHLTFSTSE